MAQQTTQAAKPVQSVAAPTQPAAQPAKPERKKTKTWLWIVAVIVALIAGIAIGYFLI